MSKKENRKLLVEGNVIEMRTNETTIENPDGSMYSARLLGPKDSSFFDKSLPMEWWTPTDWLFRTMGLVGHARVGPPPDSGAAWVMSPYVQFYSVVYGVLPIADLPKYRLIYRNRPEVKSGIDTQVTMAMQNWFIVKHKVPEIAEYLNLIMSTPEMKEAAETMMSDMITYGNCFGEILWSDKVKAEELTEISPSVHDEIVKSYADKAAEYLAVVNEKQYVKAQHILRLKNYSGKDNEILVAKEKHNNVKASMVGIKAIDPLYMRVRRDSWGNVYGYIQWISFPPAVIDNDSLIHIKWNPKSWSYENAYGTSDLMPILKHIDLLNQFENDAGVWMHYRAIPPLVVKGGGDPEHFYSTDQMKDLIKRIGRRTPASTIFVKSDVQIDEIKGAASNLNVKWWIEYLTSRILMAVAIPPMLIGMGMPGSMRGVSEIVFQAHLGRIKKIQETWGSAVTQQLLIPLVKERFGVSAVKDYGPPEIHWNPLVEEDRNQRQKRVIQSVVAGLLTPNEGRLECGYDKLDDPEMDKIRYVDPLKLALLQIQAKQDMFNQQQAAKPAPGEKPSGDKSKGGSANTKDVTSNPKGVHPKPQQTGMGGIAKGKPTSSKMPLELNREDMEQPSSINRDDTRLFPELRSPMLSESVKSSLDKVIDKINQDDVASHLRGLIDAAMLELGANDVLTKDIKAKAMTNAKAILAVQYESPEEIEASLREFEAIVDGIISESTKV